MFVKGFCQGQQHIGITDDGDINGRILAVQMFRSFKHELPHQIEERLSGVRTEVEGLFRIILNERPAQGVHIFHIVGRPQILRIRGDVGLHQSGVTVLVNRLDAGLVALVQVF